MMTHGAVRPLNMPWVKSQGWMIAPLPLRSPVFSHQKTNQKNSITGHKNGPGGGRRCWGKRSGFGLVLSHRERVKDKLPGGSEACCSILRVKVELGPMLYQQGSGSYYGRLESRLRLAWRKTKVRGQVFMYWASSFDITQRLTGVIQRRPRVSDSVRVLRQSLSQ